jgi:hypothetical protein
MWEDGGGEGIGHGFLYLILNHLSAGHFDMRVAFAAQQYSEISDMWMASHKSQCELCAC